MCDTPLEKLKDWKGWIDVPAPEPFAAQGPWIDISFRLNAARSRSPGFPEPRFEKLMTIPEHPANLTEMQMVAHFGTHLDAPLHFITEGPAMDAVPLDRLYGQGVVLKVEAGDDMLITADHLDRASPSVEPGDIVVIDSGWTGHMDSERYFDHPALTLDAAEWLVDKRAKMLAVDLLTPDMPSIKRPDDFTWPVHHELLGKGVLIAELVCVAPELSGRRIEAMFVGLNIEGSDGAPVRALARAAD